MSDSYYIILALLLHYIIVLYCKILHVSIDFRFKWIIVFAIGLFISNLKRDC